MFEETAVKVAAEVSLRKSGVVYIGKEARAALNAGYNERVRVRIPNVGIGESDVTVKGCLNDSHHICVGKAFVEKVEERVEAESRSENTFHVDAIVEKAKGTWYDGQEDKTKERWEDTHTLGSRTL